MPTSELHDSILACDLDGTLVEINTFPHFVRMALVKSLTQGHPRAFLCLAWALIRRKFLGGTHLELKEAAHRVGEGLGPDITRVWAAVLYRRWANAEVSNMVSDWAGLTILVTAAPSIYATFFGELAGFDLVQGSEYQNDVYVENVHRAKAEKLVDRTGSRLACAITDDIDLDGPLLALASRRLLVRPNGQLAEIA